MQVSITGVGAWGPGVSCASDIAGNSGSIEDVPVPKPDLIPARELRRSPAASRLGVEVARQACLEAGQDPSTVRSVFASALGDSDITDYMCRTLAGEDKLLSPTRFHNSVHNAAAGCWSIACENTAPNTFVAGFSNTAGMALLESTVLTMTDGLPTLLVVTDVPIPGALADIHGAGTRAALALMIENPRGDSPVLHCEVTSTSASALAAAPDPATDPAQATAQLWPLVGAVAMNHSWQGEFGLGSASMLVSRLGMKH